MGLLDGYGESLPDLLPDVGQLPPDNPAARFKGALRVTQDQQPDQVAEDAHVGQAIGVPLDFVAADRQMARQKKLEDDAEKMFSGAPLARDFLAKKPTILALAKDDLHNLAALESVLNRNSQPDPDPINQLTGLSWLGASARRAIEAGDVQNQIAYLQMSPQTAETSTKLAVLKASRPKEPSTDGWLETGWVSAMKMSPQLWETFKASQYRGMQGAMVGGTTGAIGGLGFGAIPGAAAGYAAGVLTGAAETSYLMEAGGAKDEFKDIRDEAGQPLDPALVDLTASGVGVVNAGIEMLQIGGLIRSIPGGQKLLSFATTSAVKEALKSATVRGALAGVGKLYVAGVAKETAQEVAQEVVTVLGGEVAKMGSEGNFENITPTEFWERMANTAYQSATAFSLMMAPGYTGHFVTDMRAARQSKADANFFKALDDNVAASKLRERMPAAHAELVDAIREQGGAPEAVYIDAAKLREASGLEGQTFNQMLDRIGVGVDDFTKAEALGADVAIPFKDYASQVAGTELSQRLREDVKFSPEGMSQNQAKAFESEYQGRVDEALKEQEQNRAQHDADMKAATDEYAVEMQKAGMTRADAELQLQPLVQGANVAAARWTAIKGETVTPAEWLTEMRKLKVKVIDPATVKTTEEMQQQFQQDQPKTAMEVLQNWYRGGLEGYVSENDNSIFLGKIVVAKDARGKGVGTAAVQQLVDYADRTGKTITLTPGTDFGGSSTARLEKFYKRFGFVKNTGRNKDFAVSETMIRRPDATLLQTAAHTAGADLAKPEQVAEAARLWAEKGVESPYFKKWFGGSKVVDAQGKPLVVYHGTGADFEAFDLSKAGANERSGDYVGEGFFFHKDPGAASKYAEHYGDKGSPNVVPAYVRLERPLTINSKRDGENFYSTFGGVEKYFEKLDESPAAVREELRRRGHDGLIDNVYGQVAAFSPTQIKSVFNRGTFDASDPRILMQSAFHGSPYRFDNFTLDHIGSGEGAQAFGYGLYFASNKKVAEYYRESVVDHGGRGFSLAGIVPASPNEGLTYDDWVATKNLSELLVPKSKVVKAFGDLNTVDQRRVMAAVRFLLQDRKVLDTVVGFVPVDVVNVLRGQEVSPESLRDNMAMFIDLLPADPKDLVPGGVQAVNALAPAVALAAAKVHTGLGRFDVSPSDFLTADGALHAVPPKVISSKVPKPSEFVKGQLYEVTIPDDDTMLDWDKPLSEQPEGVKKALESDPEVVGANGIPKYSAKRAVGGGYYAVVDVVDANYNTLRPQKIYREKVFKTYEEASTGAKELFADRSLTGQNVYVSLSKKLGSDRAASEYLKSIGIPGLRYLDGTSRGKGEGHHNYLVFDDAQIAIDKTYYQGRPDFFSPTARFVDAVNVKKPQPAKFWLDQMFDKKGNTKPGLRPEELDDLGLRDWLEGADGPVSKEQVLQFIKDGGPKLEEVRKGEERNLTVSEAKDILAKGGEVYAIPVSEPNSTARATLDDGVTLLPWIERNPASVTLREGTADAAHRGDINTKFSQYQLPGGENYREVLLTVPPAGAPKTRGDYAKMILEPKYGDNYLDAYDKWTDQERAEYKSLPGSMAGPAGAARPAALFTSSHWSEPNVLAHYRLNDRTDADGKRVLFIEEIQSDWHQAGRKKGYAKSISPAEYEVKHDPGVDGLNEFPWVITRKDTGEEVNRTRDEETAHYVVKEEIERREKRAIPDAPFKKSWPMLAFKRILREAVEKGYDSVAWTTGEQQAERYDLSKQIKMASAIANGDGTYNLVIEDKSGNEIEPYARSGKKVTPQELEDTIGKDLAAKLVEGAERNKSKPWPKNVSVNPAFFTLRGLDLKVGGEGMKGFYDKMLPKAVQDYVKKLDPAAKVGVAGVPSGKPGDDMFEVVLPNGKVVATRPNRKQAEATASSFDGAVVRSTASTETVHSLPITPAMRDAILANGQALYQAIPQGARGSISFTDRGTFISLFKGSANFSTLLHETGHLFVNDMEAMVATGKASAQIVKDLAALKAFAGDLKTTEGQEKLAVAFEHYLREGKAPSIELEKPFQRFRAWLTAIYSDMQVVLNGEDLTPEIRGVFDRMLAAENEIKAAEGYRERRAPLDAVATEMLTAAEQKRLQAQRAEGHDEAVEKRTKRYLSAYMKALGGKEELTKQAKAEVDVNPLYRTVQGLVEDGGLPFEVLEASFGPEVRKDLTTKFPGLVGKKGEAFLGAHDLDLLAVAHDFKNGEEMIAALTAAKPKGEAVKDLTAQKIAAEEARVRAFAKNADVEADADIHNDGSLGALVLEGLAIQRKSSEKGAQTRHINAQALKDVAQGVLDTMTVSQGQRFDRFLAAERKAAAEGAKAVKAEDWNAAAAAKSREALSHALVLEAVKLREETARQVRRAVRIAKSKSMDFEAKEQVLALVEAYGLGSDSMKPARPEELTTLAEYFTKAYGEDDFGLNPLPFFSSWVLNRESPGGYKNLTVAQMKELSAVINALSDIGGSEHARMVSETDMTRADKVAELVAAVNASGYATRKFDRGTTTERVTTTFRDILASLQKMPDLFRNADGNVDVTPGKAHLMGPHQEFGERIFRGTVKALEIMYAHEELPGIEKQKLDFAKRFKKQFGERTAEVNGVPMSEVRKIEGVNSWTAERIWSLALNMGNEGNLRTLLEGDKLTIDQFNRLTSVLSEKDWKAIQATGDMLGKHYADTDRVFRQVYGFPAAKRVEPLPFDAHTAEGTTVRLAGWYFPIKVDAELNPEIGTRQDQDILKGDPRNKFAAFVSKGHTRERTGTSRPVTLSYEVAHRALHDQAKFIAMAPAIKDAQAIFNNLDYRRAMVDAFGKDAYEEVMPWLKNVANPVIDRADSFDGVLNKMRHLSTLYILGLNLKSASKQYLGLAGTANKLGLRWTASGLAEMAKFGGMGVDFVNENSAFMHNREEGLNPELAEINAKARGRDFRAFGVKTGLSQKQVTDAVMVLTRLSDRHVTYSTWLGAFKKGQQELGLDHQASVEFADRMVRRTQMSGSAVDTTAWQRDEGGKRFLTMFMSEAIPKSSRMRSDLAAYKNGQMTAAEYGRSLFYESIAPAIGYTAFMGLVGGEDKKTWLPSMFWQLYSETVGLFPLLGSVHGVFEYGKTTQNIPALTGIDVMLKLTKRSAGFAGSSEDKAKLYKALVDAMAYLHGVGNARRIYETAAEGWKDIDQNKTANPFRLFIKKPKK